MVLSKKVIGPNSPLGKTDTRVICGSLVNFLKHSLWTPELEHALEKFSFGAFLDRAIVDGSIGDGHLWRGSQAKKFFDYLGAHVSLPSRQSKYQLQLITSVRKKLNFITIMPPSTWNMLCLPSTATPVQRNSTS